MPAELEPPTQPLEPESSADPEATGAEPIDESALAVFPYETTHVGSALPTADARGVLCSSESTNADENGAVGSTSCPSCGNETINGAGLFTCLECEWVGSLR